jgi:AmiR/NasT family two-component response regulator
VTSPAAALAEAHRQIITLRAGLERRTVIGQAIGITMIQTGITAEAAFADLVHRSQNANVKVRDLADQIVHEADARATRIPPGARSAS